MKKLIFTLIFGGLIAIYASTTALAQTTKSERRPIKNFGSSLKENSDKKKNTDENKARPGLDEEVVRIQTTMVVNDILILDKDFHSVTGLKKDDFIIKEDDTAQNIESFSLGDDAAIPRSIVLIIDYSGSQLPYIKTSVEAAKVLVDKLNPNDRMAIVTDDVKLLADFTGDKTLLKKKLDSLEKEALFGTPGRSRQYSALLATLNEMFEREDIRPIIILQTDGDELRGLKQSVANQFPPPPPPMYNLKLKDFTYRDFSYEDICAAIEKSRAVIYTIIPGLPLIGISSDEQISRTKIMENNRIAADVERINRRSPTQTLSSGQSAASATSESTSQSIPNRSFRPNPGEILKSMTEEHFSYIKLIYLTQQERLAALGKFSGGWNDYLEKPEQADEVYSRILAGINHRYVIGYYSNNEVKDGKLRTIKIEVKNHPEYTVWGRKTYFAPEN